MLKHFDLFIHSFIHSPPHSLILLTSGKNAQSRNAEEFFKIFRDRDPEVNDFQNLTSSSFTPDTSLVKFS